MRKTTAIILVLLSLAGLTGCGGGGARIENRATTLGRELMDLHEAYKSGAISEDEYHTQRQKLLNRR